MKKLIIILSLLIVVLIGCSKSENDNIINNVEEINNKEKHLYYYYDVNPIEFLGLWELKKKSEITKTSFEGTPWDSHPIPKKLEFKIDTNYIANTTLTINTDDEEILYPYWMYRGSFIEASSYGEPDEHPIQGMFNKKNYFLAVVSYDENNIVIHHFYSGKFYQLEYEKTNDYNIEEYIELTKG